MKVSASGVVCLCLLLPSYFAFGREIAPIEWEMRDPQRVWGNYEASGMCRFTYFQTYHPGEVKLNVTFNKFLTSFNDYDSWQRLDVKPGVWYYSQSMSWINPGNVEKIEFKIRWSIFDGRERPDGVCISNVGTATNRIPVVPSGANAPATGAPAPTTSSTTSSTVPTTPTTTPTTPSTTTTVPRQRPGFKGCTVMSTHGNIWTTTNYRTRSSCMFHFDLLFTVPMGTLKVNVTFDKPIEQFDDFGLVNRIVSRPGYWYYGRSKWDLNYNQPFDYAFDIEWKSGDAPHATCYVDFGSQCRLATPTTQQPQFPVTQTPAPTSTASTSTTSSTTTTPTTSILTPTIRASTPTTSAPTPSPTTSTMPTTPTTPTTPSTSTTRTTPTPTPTTTTASTTSTTPTTTTTTDPTTTTQAFPTFRYVDVIDMSMDFYAAQRSGALPDNRIPWRGDSALGDSGDNGEDLSGGYYDAGDHVKFNLPMASSMTLLAWGQYVFADAYEDFSLDAEMRETIKWGLDYLLKCWKPDPTDPIYYAQVGNGYADHAFWGRAEEMTMPRPAYKLTKNSPGSDVSAETASAFAAGSLIFREVDPTYSDTLLDAAKSIYSFAETYQGIYSASISNAAGFYPSGSFSDELMLGAIILYEATGDQTYKTKALNLFSSIERAPSLLSWEDKSVLAQLLLYNITKDNQYKLPVQDFLMRYRGDVPSIVMFVDGVLAWRNEWAPNRYAANAALIAVLAAEVGIDPARNVQWAQSQIDYLLGMNKDSFSYVMGFGNNYPLKPRHRGSSCPDLPADCDNDELASPLPNPQILNGAMVGGPQSNGVFVDDRNNFRGSEVACDYNAGFTSVLAGLTHFRSLLV